MATPFKLKGSPMERNFGDKSSPKMGDKTKTGQRKYVRYNKAGNRVDMMGREHTAKARANTNMEGGKLNKRNVGYKAKSTMPKAFNMTGSSKAGEFVKVAKKFSKKAGRFLGGKTLGIAGMLGATSSKADQPKGKAKRKGSYTGDFTKLKK
mgnify:FL=1